MSLCIPRDTPRLVVLHTSRGDSLRRGRVANSIVAVFDFYVRIRNEIQIDKLSIPTVIGRRNPNLITGRQDVKMRIARPPVGNVQMFWWIRDGARQSALYRSSLPLCGRLALPTGSVLAASR